MLVSDVKFFASMHGLVKTTGEKIRLKHEAQHGKTEEKMLYTEVW